jgi:hypothetical protein
MGQYYIPCILTENKKQVKAWVYSHDIKYNHKRSDGSVIEIGNGLKLMEHSYLKNDFVMAFESLIIDNPENVVWCGDYADEVKGCKTNLYDRCKDKTKVIPIERPTIMITRYVINHDKKEFVDKYKVVENEHGYKLHPLPLLTCNSNGRGGGGGDFYVDAEENQGNVELIGKWAYDKISVSSKKPKGYNEIIFDLVER